MSRRKHARVGLALLVAVVTAAIAVPAFAATSALHGHRWRTAAGVPEDTRTLGPAESFRVSWREDAPGTWLYHCHVEQHMEKGMIGIYWVSR
jgi:FtsP/CotA-like multicopper oxidase with cupredoxin domain